MEQTSHAPATDGDDQPTFPVSLFQTSNWSLQDLKHLNEVGKGKDTVIYSASCPRLGDRLVAVKVYDRNKVAPTKLRAIKREIAMMMFFGRQKVPHVVDFYGAFQDDDHVFIVMEYCAGGDLLEHLLRDKKAMSERRAAAEVARPLLSVLARLHALRVIHRDIKLENVFIDAGGRVKLGDFGLTMSMRQEAAISPVGTVEYMAPEVVALPPVDLVTSGQVRASAIPPTSEKVDIWALGVTLFELVTGRLPFEGKDKAEIKRAITAYTLSPFPSYVSPHCQAMIRSMLAYYPEQRPTAEQLLAHPYIQMYCPGAAVVSLTARAGPPSLDAAQHAQQEQHGQQRGGSVVVRSYKDATSPAVALVSGFPTATSVSSRELSTHSMVRVHAVGSPTNVDSRRASSGAWAALRRLSGGHRSSAAADADGAAQRAAGWSGSGDQHHTHQQLQHDGAEGDAQRAAAKSGVRSVVRRLFSRQSAPHRLEGAALPGSTSPPASPLDRSLQG